MGDLLNHNKKNKNGGVGKCSRAKDAVCTEVPRLRLPPMPRNRFKEQITRNIGTKNERKGFFCLEQRSIQSFFDLGQISEAGFSLKGAGVSFTRITP
jgi:hypothetical protein